MTDRDLVMDALQKMPPETSLTTILEELALLARVRERLARVEGGQGGKPQEEVARLVDQWTSK
jgi:hypothetical protein